MALITRLPSCGTTGGAEVYETTLEITSAHTSAKTTFTFTLPNPFKKVNRISVHGRFSMKKNREGIHPCIDGAIYDNGNANTKVADVTVGVNNDSLVVTVKFLSSTGYFMTDDPSTIILVNAREYVEE